MPAMSGSASTMQGSSHSIIVGQYLSSALCHSLTMLKQIIGITRRRIKDQAWMPFIIHNRAFGWPTALQKKLVFMSGWSSLRAMKPHGNNLRRLKPYRDPKWWVSFSTGWHAGQVAPGHVATRTSRARPRASTEYKTCLQLRYCN